MTTDVSSPRGTKLTDLSLATLTRIAFLIVGTPYSEHIFDDYRWSRIQSFRATCRLFHEAANLTMGTLALVYRNNMGLCIKSKEDPQNDCPMTIPLEVVLSLPCLRELRVLGEPIPNSLARALEVIPGLKAVELNNQSESSTIRFKAFKSASTIEKLHVQGFREQAVKDLFSFRYDRLTDLTFDDLDHWPVIPQHVMASVKSVTLSWPKSEEVDLKECYESLSKGRNLQSFTVNNCSLEGMDFLHMDTRFAALDKLRISSVGESTVRRADYSRWLTKALRKGRFPYLQEFKLDVSLPFSGDPISIMSEFESALIALGPSLRRLVISTDVYLTEKDISVLRRLQSSCAFELHITLEQEDGNEEVISMQLFTGLSSLTSIGFRGYALENVDELASFPNLKEVCFTRCGFAEKDALKLKETRGSIEKITFCMCEASREDVLWDGTMT